MSRMVNEIQDGVLPKDQTGLELNDDGSGGSDGGVVLKKGPWTSAEDAILIDYVNKHGEGNWNNVQKYSGLSRCGKSCRLRWANHLRPNLKKGAFTAEEEQLIAELHAKMGNKWARMAAHLPGRTDNEIKNYWNTRIKRRQRAGLPLYPPEVCLQPFQEGQHGQSTGRINGGDRGHYDFLQKNSFDLHDAVLDSMEANRGVLPYVPEIPDFSANRILLKGLNSSQYDLMPSTLPHHKRPRESMIPAFGSSGINSNGFFPFGPIQDDTSDKIAQSFQMHSSIDPGPSLQNSLYYSHSLLNGNTSASKPPSEAAKLELPSLQYPETDLGSWGRSSSPPPLPESVDVFIQSPPSTGELESDCSSPHNSGLLDALLHQAKTLLSSKTNYSNKSSNSSTATPGDRADSLTMNMYETEWEDYADPISPFGETSFLNECPAIIANGNSLDEQPPSLTFKGNNVKVESIDQVWTTNSGIQSVSLSSITRPDFLLAADWGEQGFRQGKNQAIMTDAVGFPLGDDLVTDCKHMTSVTSTSSQVLGFGSCGWNNMPAVYQMTDLP